MLEDVQVRRWKKFLSISMIAVMVGSMGMTAFAEENTSDVVDTTVSNYTLTEEETADKSSEEIEALQQQKIESVTQAAYDMKIASNELPNWPQGPATYGEAGIVMDAKSGAILYAKNIDGKAYPASITKVLTALIALENGNLDDTITITDASTNCIHYGDAHIGMTAGEEISLNDALHALLMVSANEVAYAIAENVGGQGYDWFVQQMNARAKELGAVNSNFVNVNGLPDENHYTTARDMALITRELLVNHEEFKQISQTLQYTIPATNLMAEERTFQQKDLMFYDWSEYYYPKVVAGKTGYTDEALNTLISCAEDENLELVCVVLKTHGKNVYTDSINLLNYGFDNFQKVSISENETSDDFENIDQDAYVVLPNGVQFSDLQYEIVQDENNESQGTVTYTYQGNPVGSTTVTLSSKYLKKDETPADNNAQKAANTEKQSILNKMPNWAKIVLVVLVALIIIVAIWMCALVRIRKKKVERNRRRRREIDEDSYLDE